MFRGAVAKNNEWFVYIYLKKNPEKDCYDNIDTSSLTNSKKFWKTVKQIFGCKLKSKNSITFVEGTKIIQEEGELAKTFNEFLSVLLKILESMKIFFLYFLLRQL